MEIAPGLDAANLMQVFSAATGSTLRGRFVGRRPKAIIDVKNDRTGMCDGRRVAGRVIAAWGW